MRIGTIPYLNGLPLTKHLQNVTTTLPPAELVTSLLNEEVDVALVPVFAILKHNLHMHPDAGIIGCDGPVASVGLFTRPYISSLSEIESIYLDRDSLTSTYLTKILLKKFYGVSLYDLEFFHHDNREMADAQLLIGDKALFKTKSNGSFADLGQLWKQHTDHGLMFACWASVRPLTDLEIQQLIDAKTQGLATLERIAQETSPEQTKQVLDYYKNNMIYEPTATIKAGLRCYHEYLKEFHYLEPRRKVA